MTIFAAKTGIHKKRIMGPFNSHFNDILQYEKTVFQDLTMKDFLAISIQLFHFQYEKNMLYREFCDRLSINPAYVDSIEKIPFLPISFFKSHQVKTTSFNPEIVFSSSGTGGTSTAHHYIKKLSIYKRSILEGFYYFYGNPAQYTFLALLPGYAEREGSSLIYMMERLIETSDSPESGFYLYDHQQLYETLNRLKDEKKKTILFGVSFALLDFAEKYQIDFPELLLFETGGMKGRRRELVKEELHEILKSAFGVSAIHSEYSMCELLSQAYSYGNNIFKTPPWMKLILRDEKDPFNISPELATGAINVIDFANIYSCAFIATDDLGKRNGNGIEIQGRMDNTEIRGCNLLVI